MLTTLHSLQSEDWQLQLKDSNDTRGNSPRLKGSRSYTNIIMKNNVPRERRLDSNFLIHKDESGTVRLVQAHVLESWHVTISFYIDQTGASSFPFVTLRILMFGVYRTCRFRVQWVL